MPDRQLRTLETRVEDFIDPKILQQASRLAETISSSTDTESVIAIGDTGLSLTQLADRLVYVKATIEVSGETFYVGIERSS
jgi:hypothetical protein